MPSLLKMLLDIFQHLKQPLKLLILIVIVLGILFRFTNLEQKVSWGDETFSAFRMAGYTMTEMEQKLINSPPIGLENLQHYLQVNPDKTWRDTLNSLATEDPHHTPLYFIIGRGWQHLLGTSLTVQRSLSALLSLLIFPAIYWLCQELFPSTLTPWIAMAIVAISPFHVLYSQEVRQYSLWTVLTLASSAALLQAIRRNQKQDWWIYSLTLVCGLYTHLFYSLVAIGQGIYLIFTQRRLTSIFKSYFIASCGAIFLFSPWLWVILQNLSRVETMNAGHKESVSFSTLIYSWALNFSRIFIDLDPQGEIISSSHNLTKILPIFILLSLITFLVYSSYYLYKNTHFKTWFFIFILGELTFLTLAIPDLILGGIRSTHGRYLIPVYLALQITVSYYISDQIQQQQHPPKITQFSKPHPAPWGKLLLIVLLSIGILSCSISSPAEVWWTKGGSYHHPEIAKIINQSQNPLLISDGKIPRILSLTYLLKPTVKIQLVHPWELPPIPAGFTLFLYAPSPGLVNEIAKLPNYSEKTCHTFSPIYQYLEPLAKHSNLWLCEFVAKD